VSTPTQPAAFTVSLFTRHSPNCKYRADSPYRRCNCRKSLYIDEGGKDYYKSARTRSWEQAEQIAQGERDRRDPVKIRLAEIEAVLRVFGSESSDFILMCS
jgi:hypothetical protein